MSIATDLRTEGFVHVNGVRLWHRQVGGPAGPPVLLPGLMGHGREWDVVEALATDFGTRTILRSSPHCSVWKSIGTVAPARQDEPVTTTWDEAFADRYERWSAYITEDVAFYAGLARQADGPLLELAIGNGRVAVPIAQATGRRVIGIDSSPAMLRQARARAAEAGVELDLRHGDMRELALEEPAALIYCPFRSLLHLPTWADRRRTFERVVASLHPQGRFAWNAFAFDHRFAARLDGEHRQEPVPHTNRYSVGDNRIDIVLDDGATSSLWWATKNEWLGLLDVAGLELEALHGGFGREPLTDDSSEYVFVARHRRR